MRKRDLLLASLALVVLRQVAAMAIDRPILPQPWGFLQAFVQSLPRELGRHFVVSGWRVVASTLLAVVVAVPLGLSPRAERLAAPVIYMLHPIPKIIFLPIVLLLLGIGNASKVVIVALILFFQVLLVVRERASSLRPELIASIRSLGAGRRALCRFVYLPACPACYPHCGSVWEQPSPCCFLPSCLPLHRDGTTISSSRRGDGWSTTRCTLAWLP